MSRYLAWAAATVIVAAGCSAPENPATTQKVDESAVRSELAARRDEYVAAALKSDSATLSDMWLPNGHALEPGFDLTGTQLRAQFQQIFANMKVTDLKIHPLDVFVYDSAVYEFGQYEETVQPTGQPVMRNEANYFLRWVRSPDGKWRMDRFVAGPRAAPGAQQ